MAKLDVAAHVLLQALFPDHDCLTLSAAHFDQQRGVVVLELSGLGVPDVDDVVAEITIERRATRFVPRRAT